MRQAASWENEPGSATMRGMSTELATCEGCGQPFTRLADRGASPLRRYCGTRCKAAAARQSRAARGVLPPEHHVPVALMAPGSRPEAGAFWDADPDLDWPCCTASWSGGGWVHGRSCPVRRRAG